VIINTNIWISQLIGRNIPNSHFSQSYHMGMCCLKAERSAWYLAIHFSIISTSACLCFTNHCGSLAFSSSMSKQWEPAEIGRLLGLGSRKQLISWKIVWQHHMTYLNFFPFFMMVSLSMFLFTSFDLFFIF
jgi:hypothetical protein